MRLHAARVLTATIMTAVTLLGLLGAPRPATAAPAADCPTPLPVHQPDGTPTVAAGTVATGLTVATGTTPQAFSAEVVGVLTDAVGPGRHLLLADLSGPVVDDAGVWAGMSGSPVYVGDDLLGAVAYGFTYGASTLAGITPAEDLYALIGSAPASPAAAATSLGVPTAPAALDRADRALVASAAPAEASALGGLAPLPLPLAVSGLRAPRLARVQSAVDRAGLGLLPHASAARTGAAGAVIPVEAGGNLATALSFGDVTMAAVGTTTFVCDGAFVGFGHPFSYEGAATASAHGANAVRVVTDPLGTSFKLATTEAAVGRVTQDRGAGVAGVLGAGPATIPVTATVTAVDTGRSRTGTTHVVGSARVSSIAPLHLLTDLDTTGDRIGRGSAQISWTVKGTRFGKPWTLQRTNRYVSGADITYDAVFELADQLSLLDETRFGPVRFTEVSASATVDPVVRRARITGVQLQRADGTFATVRALTVRPGQRLRLRVVLAVEGGGTRTMTRWYTIPRSARGAGTLVAGADVVEEWYGEEEPCLFPGACDEVDEFGSKATTFAGFLAELEAAPRNDAIRLSLWLPGGEFEEPRRVKSLVGHTNRVVTGSATVRVTVRR